MLVDVTQAIDIARSIGDKRGEATRLFNVATAWLYAGDVRASKKGYEATVVRAKGELAESHPILVQSRLMLLRLANLEAGG